MRKAVCLAVVLAASSVASAVMKEDFESYNLGVLSGQGWVFAVGQDGEVITGANGTKVAQAYNQYYMQGTHGAPGSGNYVFTTGINVSTPGLAYIAAQMRPKLAGGYVSQTQIGSQRSDGYPGVLVGVDVADNATAYNRLGRFSFEPANWSSMQRSEDVVMFDSAYNGYIFDIALNLRIVSSTQIYATLCYRNVSLGGNWVQSRLLTNVPFDNTFGIQSDARTYLRGYFGTEIDNFRMGVGWVGMDAALKEDFESYNLGVLSGQGWVFAVGQDGEVITGANGTKVAQAYNNYYMQGTHGASGSGNYTFATGIDVSGPGYAYIAAQMRPKMAGGYVSETEIGSQRADGYPGALVGVDVADNATAYNRMGRFCFESPNWYTLQHSEDIVMFDSSYNGYVFDIAVNLNIVNSSTIYATLSYRNVTLGGNWIKSTLLDNVTFDNTFGIQNDARTYLRGYFGTEIDNFRMGMGQYGAAAMRENFESYSLGVLSAQGWTFAPGQNGEVITGANGTKVAQAYNYGYMQGTNGVTFPTGINVSVPGQAYLAVQMRPRSAGGYVPQTEIGAQRSDGYPGALIGIDAADNASAYDGKGRFCFEAVNWGTLQRSENVLMSDSAGNPYTFDIGVNLDIVNSSEIYATLYYRNVSLGGDWIQSSLLTNIPFDNTYGVQNTARTYLRGYLGTEIDNFQLGMGHVGGVTAGCSPVPDNGTGGVSPNAVLKWKKGIPAPYVPVFFGTSATAVANATTASPEYMGVYDPSVGFDVHNYNAGGLTPGATYYWRVGAADPAVVSRVWSFTVNGGIVASDTQQAEDNASPTYTPFTHGTGSANFTQEPGLFAYAPRFLPGVMSFDGDNKPYTIAGTLDAARTVSAGTGVQTLNSAGRWINLDPYQSIKAAYPLWNGAWSSWDGNIVFDNDNDAYMIAKINAADIGNSPKTLLLYSRDRCWTWACYELPITSAWAYGARLEARKGFNEIIGPPAIVGDSSYLGGGIELIVPTKSNGVLTIPSPTVIYSSTPAWLTPGHSGFGNVAVTKGNYTHVIWMTMDNLTGHTGQSPVYAATYTRSTKAVSSPVLLGYAPTQDDHEGPVMTMDSSGYLHVIIGAHGNNYLQYGKSPAANSTAGTWTLSNVAPSGGSPAYTYTALLCDANNTLHLVSRYAGDSYYFKLSYLYKTSTGSWQPNTTLVDPNRPYYMVWYHELTVDRENRLFLRYSTNINQLDRGGNRNEVNGYKAHWPAEAAGLHLVDDIDDYNTIAHDPVVLIKDNQGQTGGGWRLAETADFFNRLFKDGFEKGEFTTAGWTKQNTNATVATAAKYTGAYGTKLAGTTWIQRTISTVGITGVHVKFSANTSGMSGSEYLYVEWSTNGTTWNALYSGRPTSWLVNQDTTCAAGAENSTGFRIRFRTNAGTTSKYAYVDDVEVTGTRF